MSGAPVEIEVQRLEELGRSGGHVVLRASGRAWSAVAQALTPPVLVAGNARVPAVTGSADMSADGSGPGWTAEFRVPATVAAAASGWAVETAPAPPWPEADGAPAGRPSGATRPVLGRSPSRLGAPPPRHAVLRDTSGPPPPAPPRAPVAVQQPPAPDPVRDPLLRLESVPGMLGAFSEELQRLERRSVDLAQIAARTRAADAQRLAAAEAGQELIDLRAALDRAERGREEAETARAAAVREAEELRRQLEIASRAPRLPVWDEPPRFPHVSPVATPAPSTPPSPAVPPAAAPPRAAGVPPEVRSAPPADPGVGPPLPHAPASPPVPVASAEIPPRPVPAPAGEPLRHADDGGDRSPTPPGRTRRRLGVGASVLAGAGTLLAADAITTVVWQEPVSAVLAARSQADLRGEQRDVADRLRRSAPPVGADRPAEARMAQMAISLRRALEPGDPVGRLRIPRVDGSWIVVAGTEPRQLRTGPGLTPDSTLPGRRSTTTISGRTTTFGAPFRDLDELRAGDRLELELPYGAFAYEVERSETTSDPARADPAGSARLVLTAPASRLGGDERRVVTAREVASTPRGPAA